MFALTTVALLFTLVSSCHGVMVVDGASAPSHDTTTTTASTTPTNTDTTTTFHITFTKASENNDGGSNSTHQPSAARSGTTMTAIFLGVGIAFLIVMVLVVYYMFRTFVCTYVIKCRSRRAAARAEEEGGAEEGGAGGDDDMSDISINLDDGDDDIFTDDGGVHVHRDQYNNWGAQQDRHHDVIIDNDHMVVIQLESPRHNEEGEDGNYNTRSPIVAGSDIVVVGSVFSPQLPSTPMNVPSTFEEIAANSSNQQ